MSRRPTRSGCSGAGDGRALARLLIAAALGTALAATAARADDETQLPRPGRPTPGGLPERLTDTTPPSAFTLGVSGSAWSGDFGAPTSTEIDAVLLSGRYRIGDLRLTASIPWMRIDSAGAIFTGISGSPLIVSPQPAPHATVRNGLGDLTLGASYLFPKAALGVDVDLSAQIKAPTGQDHLSTGQVDYAVGAELSRSVGRLYPFLDVTYRSFGDTRSYHLKDGVATSVGAGWLFGRSTLVMLSYDYAQRASRFIPDSHEVVGSFSSRIGSSRARISSFVGGGLSRGAADISGGLSLSLDI